ncbi:MAG: PQ-loop repeat-containing protein [Chloroflexi bacterium]|nr:PQ-loop repeat-containing protein [Chloroflexota bacterium]
MTDFVGFSAFLITVIYTCLGLPVQIRKNYRSKSTAGLSPFMILLMACAFSTWVIYGLIKSDQDWYIVGSNFPGAVFSFTILSQTWRYRSRAKRQD